MAVFTITSFATFAGLLLAAKKLATEPNPIDQVKALADLATNAKALTAALRDTGLTPLAREMAQQAEEVARHFTHPGPARDDALAVFWQVAPEALADPAVFATSGLDAAAATDRMVAAIKASPRARDFTATRLPEAFFRQVAQRILSVMLAKSDFIAEITPDLWRETLRRHGVRIEPLVRVAAATDRTEGNVDELKRARRRTHGATLRAS